MLSQEDFKNILEFINTPIMVLRPIFNENQEIYDFSMEFLNELLKIKLHGLVNENEKYSQFKKRLYGEFPWFNFAVSAIKNKTYICESFYSKQLKMWIQVRMSPLKNNLLSISLENVSQDKEYEAELEKQNKKLAEVSEMLEESQKDLNTQLESIKTLNSQLYFAAFHDSLTNLYNLAWLNSNLKLFFDECEKSETKLALILFDIDNLKDINDSEGHNRGDEIIRNSATIFRLFENENIIPLRFGGDEFIVIHKNLRDKDQAQFLASKILEMFNAEGIGLSGGISIFPDDTKDYDDLLKFADMAKSDVKRNGKNNTICFHSVMQEKFLKKLHLETKLSKATADKQFKLYFQPQFEIKTEKVRGFEALLRWYDDELGWISPEQFIPIAEETNLVIPIGDWVLDTALKTLEEWEKKFNFNGMISVNVSPVQFKQDDFLEKFNRKLNKYKISPNHLELELTEGMLIADYDMTSTIKKLNQLKEKQIGISLDDFGTGYSSLRYLQMLPLTTLKIDKSFVKSLKNNGIEADITESIISLVQKMGLDTIAEGVETEEQIEALKKLNCQYVQGFLTGKPMPKILCEKMLGGDKSAILTIKNYTPENF